MTHKDDAEIDQARLAWQMAAMDATVPSGPDGSPERAAQLRDLAAARAEYERLARNL